MAQIKNTKEHKDKRESNKAERFINPERFFLVLFVLRVLFFLSVLYPCHPCYPWFIVC